MIIAFSGVDCAGKSTQIRCLEEYFVSQGKTCKILWYRPGYSKELQQCKAWIRGGYRICKRGIGVAKRLLNKALPNRACDVAADLQGSIDEAQASRVVEAQASRVVEAQASRVSDVQDAAGTLKLPPPLWLVTAFIDTVLQWGVVLRAQASRYDVVICDRYFEDAKLDIAFKYPQYVFAESLFEPIRRAIPRPDVALLLMLPFETMCERSEAKNEPFPDSPKVRALRYRAYEFLADDGVYRVIDSTGSIEETHRRIIAAIEEATAK